MPRCCPPRLLVTRLDHTPDANRHPASAQTDAPLPRLVLAIDDTCHCGSPIAKGSHAAIVDATREVGGLTANGEGVKGAPS